MKQLWGTLRDFLPLLPAGARRFLSWYVVLTSALTVLDVVAMSLLVLVITPVASSQPITIPVLGTFPQTAAPWLILVACVLIMLKSGMQVLLHFIATRRLATYEFEIGRRLFNAYIHSTWEERTKRSIAEITRIADTGIANVTAGFILPLAGLPGNILTIVLIIGVLVVAQPVTALVALIYLGIVAVLINRLVARKTLEAAEVNLQYTYRVARLMTEMVEALKELTLRNRLTQISDVVASNRALAVRARANNSFLLVLPRYAYEAALIGGFVLVGGVAFLTSDLTGAIVAVALFGATGFRLIPALVGLQSSLLDATRSIPGARDVVGDLHSAEKNVADPFGGTDVREIPAEPRQLTLSHVDFSYPGAKEPVLRGLDLDIPLGSSLGIVGPSGAGKSTLIDLLLGLSTPSAGSISVDGVPLAEIIHSWRDRVGYVPQRVSLFDGSIAQNVALTWEDDFDREKVRESLRKAHLLELVESRPEGIDARIGERGMTLSGGQQQRLGIARSLYSDPLVLVLDEATSSLDTKTEDDVSSSIRELKGQITLIAVAHRISTIKDFDQICYLDDGRILGKDSFARLAAALPQFGLQVALAGLDARPLDSDPAVEP